MALHARYDGFNGNFNLNNFLLSSEWDMKDSFK